MHVKFFLGIDGAKFEAIKAFVLHGFPITKTFTDFLAYLSKILPYSSNIYEFYYNKSFLSMPGPLGFAPSKIATSISVNPS
jgi:hypothetical protein